MRRQRGTQRDHALRFELDAVDGSLAVRFEPRIPGRTVRPRLDKPDGIVFVEDETLQPLGQDPVWTFAELDDFARLHAITLFQDAIRSGCSGVLGPLQSEICELVERSAWALEIGHVIGLVDSGLAQQSPRRDADRGRRDASEGASCTGPMRALQCFDVLLSRLQAGQSPDIDFCEHRWADLRTRRSSAPAANPSGARRAPPRIGRWFTAVTFAAAKSA